MTGSVSSMVGKIALAIGTLLPGPYIVWVLSQPVSSRFGGWHPFHLVLLLIMALVWIYYLYDVWRNPRIPDDHRALWAALIVFGNLAVEPVYFWKFIREGDGIDG